MLFRSGGEASVPDIEGLKIALFGGNDNISDEMVDEVKRYAKYIMERENGNK